MAGDFEKDFEAQLEVFSKIDVFQKEKEEMMKLRRVNMPVPVQIPRKEHEANKKQLKSDLKKSTAFVKKIRLVTAEGIQQCIRETETLNLTLYISEIVCGLLATAFKATDVGSIIKLCACFHQRYEEFTEPLVSGLKLALMTPPADDDNDAGKRKRIQIRFLIELYQVGIFLEEDFFVVLLRSLVGKSKGTTNRQPMDIHALGTFAKYGSEVLMGYLPRKLVELAQKAEKPVSEMPLRLLTSMKVCNELRSQITDTFQQLSGDLVKYHKEYYSREAKSEKDKLIHGSITEQKQLELDQSKRIFERLLSIVTTLSECTGDAIPELEIEKEEEDGARGLTVWEGIAGVPEEVGGGLYGDAESRAFYEDLPDLLTLVPLTILGFTPEQAAALREEWAAKKAESVTAADDTQSSQDKEIDEIVAEEEEDPAAVDTVETVETAPSGDIQSSEPISAVEGEGGGDESRQSKMNTLLAEKLPESLNKQKADDFCTAFCFLNSKGARKKLVTAMVKLPRNRSELAPTYARIVASLSRLYPEITEPILEALRKEFHGMVRARNQLYVENKIKNVRYQAELVKFGVAPPIVALRMFKSLLADFTQHNVELLAVLLETCGRFLYLMPHTNPRMNEILDTMMRLRRAKNLDLRQQTLLESAYFAVKPPERVHRIVKQYSVVQQYARYLIQVRVDDPKTSVEEVIKSLRRLPWGSVEENIPLHVIKAVLKVARTKYVSLPNVADCLSGLARYYPNLVTQLVDRVLEELQRSLDSPYKREIQRSLGLVRLLGELYNFTAVSSTIIFDLLYHLLNFGHSEVLTAVSVPTDLKVKIRYDPRIPADVDPANDLFRAQLVCEMLNTCGLYYVRGQAKDRLSKYLMYFQRYLLTKQHVPLHVEFSILDAMDSLEELAREAVAQTQKKGNKHSSAAPQGAMFPRYDNMEDVQAAIEAYELTHLAGEDEEEEDENVRDSGDKNATNEIEGEDDLNDDQSDSDSQEGDDSGSDDDDEEDGDDVEEEEDDGLSESEAAAMLEKLRIAEEDDDFEKAFKDVMQASVSAAGNVKFNDVNRMAIPAMLPKPKNAFRPTLTMDEVGDDEQASERTEGGVKEGRVAFKLLSRDTKGRYETRQLLVPERNPMAVKLVRAEEEMRVEKRRLKEQILNLECLSEIAEAEGGEVVSSGVFGLRDSYQKPVVAAAGAGLSGRGGGGGGRGSGSGYLNPNYLTSGRAGGGRYGGLSTFTRGNGAGVKLVRAEETRKPADSLNLDQFLAESSASELRQNYPIKRK